METVEKQVYSIQRPASRVKQNDFNIADETSHPASPDFYLLIDYQDHIGDDEIHSFCRVVQKINDASSVEDASLRLREIHAENQRVIFHALDIIRNERKFSALTEDNIKVYQREMSLESHVTDNLLTVSITIDDLRVGDLIDFQKTIVERVTEHPLWVKHHRATFWLDWSCLVLLQKIRITNLSSQPLSLHHHRLDDGKQVDHYLELKPREEFERQYENLVPKSIESTAPAWLWTDFMQVTTQASWKQISQYLYRYYTETGVLEGSLEIAAIDRIKLVGDKHNDAIRIIRFVQNEIRYRGENHGIYTHTPKSPQYVLRKGAGDCKDKSNLLVALLNAIEVEANLVLVNTDYGKGIDIFKPSPRHFNHMIVRVCVYNRTYYFDPTIQKQAGDIEHATQLNYGYGLNLTGAGADLARIPYDFSKKVFTLKHVFDFLDAEKGNGNLAITREYHAHRADNMRYHFDSNEVQKIQQDYLQWARDDTDLDLSAVQAISVVNDDKRANRLTTVERYKISNMNKTHSDGKAHVTTDFYQDFPIPDDKRFPVQITADGAMEHSLEIKYRFKPGVEPTELGVSNLHFSYLDKVWLEGTVLKFNTLVIPYKELVKQSEIEQYKSDVEEMYERCTNRFPWHTGVGSSLGWHMLVWALLLVGLVLVAGVYLY